MCTYYGSILQESRMGMANLIQTRKSCSNIWKNGFSSYFWAQSYSCWFQRWQLPTIIIIRKKKWKKAHGFSHWLWRKNIRMPPNSSKEYIFFRCSLPFSTTNAFVYNFLFIISSVNLLSNMICKIAIQEIFIGTGFHLIACCHDIRDSLSHIDIIYER